MGLFSRDESDSDDGSRDDDRNLFEGRGFVASAIVAGALIVCGIVFFTLGGSDTPAATPTPTSTPTATGSTQPPTGPPATPDDPTPDDPTPDVPSTPPPDPPAKKGPCSVPPGDQRLISSPPAGVSWRFESGLLVPTKKNVGPENRDADGVMRCFAHSPTGSVFAAMVTLAQLQNDNIAVPVIERRIAPGAGRNIALAALRHPTPGPPDVPPGSIQFIGFKILDYTGNRAVLSLAVQTDPDKLGGMQVTMIWSGGDWKLALRSDGSVTGQPDLLQALDGYVRFRGA